MKKVIFLVEDDEFIAINLLEFLESEGYKVHWVSNGKIALETLEALDSLPSAIILDLMMPEMNGIEFRKAQEKTPRIAGIPVLLMSADSQIEMKTQKMGVIEYVRKPIDIDKLSEKLASIVA